MKKIIILIIMLMPINVFAISVPSRNAILIDQDSGRILYSKNKSEKHLIASTTKIMTAVIAIESGKLDNEVTISKDMTKSHGSGIYIKPYEKISLRNLVYGLLLRSGNDAALAIETYLGGHNKFINLMNEKAKKIGMKNTIFNNSSGLDDEEKGNYSTVYDMAILMKYANNLFDFKEIDSTKKITIETNKNVYSWTNKNKLLFSYKYCNGGKTGYTKKAKRTLVTSASKNDVNLIAVTFNDKDDFNTHKKLYEYGFLNYKNYLLINKNNIKFKNKKYYVKNNYYYLMTNKERDNININVKYYKNKSDNEAGYIEVFYKNKSIHKETIYKK